jgi:Flp pilus assembly protein TadD
MERQAKNAVLAGEGDAYVRMLRQRLAVAPEANAVRLELAGIYEKGGYADLALEHVRAARERDAGNEALAIEEARLLRKLELPAEAARTLAAYTTAHPDAGAATHSRLAVALDEAGRPEEAGREHRRAVELEPDQDAYHNNLGFHLFQQQQYEEAVAEFEKALDLNRRSDTARANLAQAMALRPGQADTAGAVAHWRMATDDAAAAHNNLAAAYIERGEYARAREEINLSLAYRKEYGPALRNLDLISQLDGQPPTFAAAPHPSLWRRFTASLKRTFVKTEEQTAVNRPKRKPVERASR